MIFILLITCGNLFLLFEGCNGTITQRPQNAVSVVNGTVIFNCTTNASEIVAWMFSKSGLEILGEYETITDYCSVRPEYRNNFRADPPGIGRTCDLTVFNIPIAFGGVYTCLDGYEPETRSNALLTVIVSSPEIVGPFYCVADFNAPQNISRQSPYVDNAPKNTFNTTLPAVTLPDFMPASNVRIFGESCSNGVCYCANGISTVLGCIASGCPSPIIKWSAIKDDFCTLGAEGKAFNATFNETFRCTATNSFNDSLWFTATADVTISGCPAAKTCGAGPDASDCPVIDDSVAIVLSVLLSVAILVY